MRIVTQLFILLFILIPFLNLYSQTTSKNQGTKKVPTQEQLNQYYNPKNWLTSEAQTEIFSRVLTTSERFVNTKWYKDSDERKNLNRFFQRADYLLLEGNVVFGYYYLGNFKWEPQWNEVWIDSFRGTNARTNVITEQAWKAAADHVSRREGLIQKPDAKIKIEGRVIDLQIMPPSLLLEVKVHSPTGTLLYRGSQGGRSSMANVVGAFMQYIIVYSRSQNGKEMSFGEFKELLSNIDKVAPSSIKNNLYTVPKQKR